MGIRVVLRARIGADVKSLVENLRKRARARAVVGPERRVTTALRSVVTRLGQHIGVDEKPSP